MNSSQINAFLCIVKHMSYSSAAKELFISQSNLSKIIQNLENELDTELFSRRGNRIALTKPGEIVLEHFNTIKTEHDNMLLHLGQYRNSDRSISIGISMAMSAAKLFAPVASFAQQNKDVAISIQQVNFENAVKKLETREIDVAITWLDFDPGSYYRDVKLDKNFWSLLVSRNNPLAEYQEINLEQARDQEFIFPLNRVAQDKFIRMCNDAGFSPKCRHHFTSFDGAVEMVASGFGAFFATNYMIPATLEDMVSLIPFFPRYPLDLSIYMRKDNVSRLASSFLEYYADAWKRQNTESKGKPHR